jgi:hypothetical protein
MVLESLGILDRPLLLVAAVVATAVNYYLLRRLLAGGPAVVDAGEGATVDCPDCGATNDADYRFCGDCASELGGLGGDDDADDSAGQLFG